MSWLGILLIGFAVTDLIHAVRRTRYLPECVGALVALCTGLLAGLTSGRDVAALLGIAVVVLLWGLTVTWGFGHPGPKAARLPLGVFLVALVGAIACSGLAPEASGPLARWLDSLAVGDLDGVGPDRFLLLLGAFAIQLSTGNVLVRLVLKATGTINPRADGAMPPTRLKGGRLLGPLERVFILALALGGQVTAASVVVAAKGLLRFPELSSRRDQDRIHQLTEYFLLGSFVSWLVALGSYVLLA
ncbi:hypothetical protein [Nocardioides sp. zg-1228]|uniref:hypothetical protein n=1 Tax=Nocardioides sp. zg-1228 TaxID=2763008 RepID=UPI001642F98A|nr:hypothetical protein [Nocardioides sp. zg-1228]MBC2935038.1 hypothetical protein [Nocardioides sp. zg-1228]QSF59005.1 hypothetical protein JX575_07510 [Nocardioides sp. zg-1228]